MDKEKSAEQLEKEKEQMKIQNEKTENVFEDKSRVPNEQNAWKESHFLLFTRQFPSPEDEVIIERSHDIQPCCY